MCTMDIPATQVFEDDDLIPTQNILRATDDREEQVGILTVDSQIYPINRGINKIGRHPSCNIVLHDQTVSKQHAEIEGHGNEVSAWLRDLNSSNRTIINSCVLRSGIWYELKDGSHINFGKVQATYTFHRASNDSMIPETPAAPRQTKNRPIIPGTPDSFLGTTKPASVMNDRKPIATRKRKAESLIGDTLPTTRSRKIDAKSTAASSTSLNKLDLSITKNSPSNSVNGQTTSLSQEERLTPKNAVVQIVRMDTQIQPAVKEFATNSVQPKQRKKGVKGKELGGAEKVERTSQVANLQERTQGMRSTRRRGKPSDISHEVGVESQEVEMIMSNASIKEQSSNSETEKVNNMEQHKKGSKTRSTRKRVNVRVDVETDTTESSVASDFYESDPTQFEVPTLKTKRARVSKNTSTVRQSLTTTRTSKLSSKATNSSNELLSTLTVKSNRSSEGRGKQLEVSKNTVNKLDIEKSSSSGIDTSLETASAFLSPCRSRRSMSSSILNTSSSKVKHKVLFTGMNNQYKKLVVKLGASQVEDVAQCTVLVTDKVRRTVKFLCALSQSVPIVSINWLLDSEKVGYFVDLNNYILKDSEAETKFRFNLTESLRKAKQRKLLDGYTVFLTPNVTPPPVPELKNMILSCGGKPIIRRPTTWPEKTVVISCEKDLANTNKFLAKTPKSVTVQSTEFILTGILRQELDFITHKLT